MNHLLVAVLAAILVGCSTMAEPNRALDRARAGYRALQNDPQVIQLAPTELTQAGEAVRTADTAWTQRQSLRTVDHLAYLAQQRVAVARETTSTRMWEKAAAAAKAGADSHKARVDAQKAQHDKSRATDLEMQLKDLNAKPTERGDVITLGDVLFDSNQAELRTGGLRDMDKLVVFFKRYPERTALIEGFTDSQGSQSDNLDLSQRRAGAVRDALIDQGVFADRLTSRGHGEAHPTSTNTTQAGRQANRRVEIVLSGENGIVRAR
jgi:outer membrane protein OmpA-like peptidoglycan-associated protein